MDISNAAPERRPNGSVRVMLCEQRPVQGQSMLLEIVRTQVLDANATVPFTLVCPQDASGERMIVNLDDLDSVLPHCEADVLLVLADSVGLNRARVSARRYGPLDVVAVTRAGYVLIDLEPRNLAAVLNALGHARREQRNGDVAPGSLP